MGCALLSSSSFYNTNHYIWVNKLFIIWPRKKSRFWNFSHMSTTSVLLIGWTPKICQHLLINLSNSTDDPILCYEQKHAISVEALFEIFTGQM